MSKVITFSRVFPSYHPKAGQPTLFVEKIWAGLADNTDWTMPSIEMDFHEYYNCKAPKWHTVRAGQRWKVGDKFSPRVWSGRPYNSKQVIISPDIEIKKVWHVELFLTEVNGQIAWVWYMPDGKDGTEISLIAKNDGLSKEDFQNWFPRGFIGQIICWNENINY